MYILLAITNIVTRLKHLNKFRKSTDFMECIIL